jgi:prepilin-type N-terminal cleavage/methylation domain-containing protein
MRTQKIKTGFTLTELLTVIAIIVVLVAIGMPAAREALESFESSAGVSNVIRLALVRARAISVRERRFAGVRFQQDTRGNQYMIFIVHDHANTGLVNGFRAAGGLDPIKLPRDVGVMDLRIRTDPSDARNADDMPIEVEGDDAASDLNINDPFELDDTTTFSIVFSPAGKMVIHDVRVRNRDGYVDSTTNTDVSDDEVFNKKDVVDDGNAMFYQDDYAGLGLGQEPSRNHFIIYNEKEFDSVDAESRWTDYLQYLEVVYVNRYTGQIINR